MSDLRELAGSDRIPDDVRTKVEFSKPAQWQPVKSQMRFATLNVVAIDLREKVMLETVDERFLMPKTVLHDEEILPAF